MQVRCLPLGPAYATSGDSTGSEMMRIVQTPQLIVMLNPDLTYRQIWMDGRALEPEPNPSWMGYSVGRWEGDTLVVESYGFHAGTWLDRDGHPHTEQLRLTERYRRPSFGTLEIEVTFSDPGAYTRPWTVKVGAEYAADTEMLEWVCNEGANRSLVHWVGTASDERKNEVKVAPEILARYVGTYVEQPPFWRSVQISGAPQPSGRTVQITRGERPAGRRHGRARQAGADRDVRDRVHRPLRSRRPVHRRRPVREARLRQLPLRAQLIPEFASFDTGLRHTEAPRHDITKELASVSRRLGVS